MSLKYSRSMKDTLRSSLTLILPIEIPADLRGILFVISHVCFIVLYQFFMTFSISSSSWPPVIVFCFCFNQCFLKNTSVFGSLGTPVKSIQLCLCSFDRWSYLLIELMFTIGPNLKYHTLSGGWEYSVSHFDGDRHWCSRHRFPHVLSLFSFYTKCKLMINGFGNY